MTGKEGVKSAAKKQWHKIIDLGNVLTLLELQNDARR